MQFDGVYMDADVWINGQHLGNQPYGYTAFRYNITPYLKYGENENILSVEVKNEGQNSRWYAGSGIYRNVTLSILSKIHAMPWGIFIKTLNCDSAKAAIQIESQLINYADSGNTTKVHFEILNPESKIVASKTLSTYIHHKVPSRTSVQFTVNNPKLWSPDSPDLYRLVCTVISNKKNLDKSATKFGIRSIDYDTEKGMFLNGERIKLKGGVLHANNGSLGACTYYRAEERRVELMKQLGYNAVRCAHNPPSTAFLNACDSLGLLVIDEAFDVWSQGWLPDDYNKYFNDWWKHDLESMVLRDRNHPSIFTWSIRNQAREAQDSAAISTAYEMRDLIMKSDPTRPVTANVAMFEDHFDGDPELWKLRDPFFEAPDLCGYSYQSSQFVNVHERLPDRIQFSSEIDPRNAFTNWMRVNDNDYVIGNFTWTAMDFMGEVSLGWQIGFGMKSHELFPWTTSYCGDIDICGFPRPRSFYRKVLYENNNQLYLFVKSPKPSFENNNNSRWGWEDVKASWTWPGYESDTLEVVAYSSCDSIMLYLNGKHQGTKTTNRATEFKAYWKVPYSSGELLAFGYSRGNKEKRCSINTASEPKAIRLTADRNIIKADNLDLCFITVEIVDSKNNIVPYADNLVNFEIKGQGKIAAVSNGNPVSLESFQQPFRKAYEGKCLLVVKSTNKPDIVSIIAKCKGLKSGEIMINTIK